MSFIDEMWHELVINGIGGRTIAEAKQRMSFAEFRRWLEYRKMRGSLSIGTRLEAHLAPIAYMINRGLGGKMDEIDFRPHADRKEADLMAVVSILNSARKH